MKSVKNRSLRAREAIGLVIVLAMLGASQGCSKSTDYGLDNTQGDNMSGPDRATRIQDLKSDYSANIVIVDQSYQNEHNVNRVLYYLASNESSLKDKLSNVVEIDITSPSNDFTTGLGANHQGAVQWSLVGGDGNGNSTYKVAVDCTASNADIDAGFQKFENSYQGTAILDSTGARVGVKIVDMIGLSNDQANTFSTNLIQAAAGLDFTTPTAVEYVSVVQIDTDFAMGNRGTVLIPSGANSGDMATFLNKALNLAKHYDQDLQNVSTLLGVQVTYQPETMTPDQLNAGIQTLSAPAVVNAIRGSEHVHKNIMIGPRTETDLATAQKADYLMIAYGASVTDVTNAMNLLPNNSSSAVAQAISDAASLYAQNSVTFTAQPSDFGVSDPTVPAALGIVESTLSLLETTAPPAKLAAAMITSVSPTTGATTVQSFTTYASLQVNLANLDPNVLSEQISSWQNAYAINSVTTKRQNEQSSYVSSLQSKYSGTQFTAQAYDLSSDAQTQALANGAQVFEQVVTSALLTQVGITTVVFSTTAISDQDSVLISADKTTLTVDLYKVTAAVLGQKLQAAIPAPAPTPSPSPSPSPVAD